MGSVILNGWKEVKLKKLLKIIKGKNHSRNFWNLLGSILNDYELRKE